MSRDLIRMYEYAGFSNLANANAHLYDNIRKEIILPYTNIKLVTLDVDTGLEGCRLETGVVFLLARVLSMSSSLQIYIKGQKCPKTIGFFLVLLFLV